MALSFVTIHPSLNMTTRLVGPRPQPTTRTPWPLRPDLSSQRWRPHARPVLPLFRLYNIIPTELYGSASGCPFLSLTHAGLRAGSGRAALFPTCGISPLAAFRTPHLTPTLTLNNDSHVRLYGRVRRRRPDQPGSPDTSVASPVARTRCPEICGQNLFRVFNATLGGASCREDLV